LEPINSVAVVWPFSLLLARQTYTFLVLVIFTIVVLVGGVVVLLVAGALAVMESAETNTTYCSNGRVHRSRVRK
jgi:hypothetical protein